MHCQIEIAKHLGDHFEKSWFQYATVKRFCLKVYKKFKISITLHLNIGWEFLNYKATYISRILKLAEGNRERCQNNVKSLTYTLF